MSSVLRIRGGHVLKGNIRISGAKNAALPILAASLLTGEQLSLKNVPDLADIATLCELLSHLGVDIQKSEDGITFNGKNIHNFVAPYDLVSKMRASFVVLGPLVARYGEAKVSLPGGCAIGTRPVDVHLNGLRALGCEIDIDQGYVIAKAPRGLKGATYTLPVISVTGTENLLMAATLAEGQTTLINAAREPEVVDLANCLIKMGAKIEGAGTDTIIINGVDSLHAAEHSILPDRIETGTFAMLAGITRGEIHLTHTDLHLIAGVNELLIRAGINLTKTEDGFIAKSSGEIHGIDVMTEPFPGFATDLQAQFMALMSISNGASMITETIFENRFMHVPELCRMGAHITVHGSSALVRGVPSLSGAQVMATDLRASVSLVMAALAAQGETISSII